MSHHFPHLFILIQYTFMQALTPIYLLYTGRGSKNGATDFQVLLGLPRQKIAVRAEGFGEIWVNSECRIFDSFLRADGQGIRKNAENSVFERH
jgi:hypothetical protein